MPEDPTEDIRQRTLDIQQSVAEASAEAVSEGGEVRVVAGAGGALKEVDLRLSAFELSGVELGELLVETIRAADRRLSADLEARIRDLMAPITAFTEDEEPQR